MKSIYWLLLGIMGLLILAVIVLVIYVYAKYGNVPVKDLPAWVLPFFS